MSLIYHLRHVNIFDKIMLWTNFKYDSKQKRTLICAQAQNFRANDTKEHCGLSFSVVAGSRRAATRESHRAFQHAFTASELTAER